MKCVGDIMLGGTVAGCVHAALLLKSKAVYRACVRACVWRGGGSKLLDTECFK